jgi:hypothetical protein
VEFHEAANIFPLDDEHTNALADDIRANGLRMPIETLDGKIIDGRRRSIACGMAGVKPTFRKIETDDPVAYVLSLNLHRRHLSASQCGMIAARAKELYEKAAKERMQTGGEKSGKVRRNEGVVNLPSLHEGTARDQAGKAVGVSGKTVDYGAKVLRDGTPALIAAVDADRIAISTAARMAAMPDDAQDEFAAKTKGRHGARKNERIEPEEKPEGVSRGVGVMRANEAINCLMRIPKNDGLRKRGFQIVTDWIRHNP